MRVFLAINLPAALRRRVWSAADALRQDGYPVKWVAEDLIHLTVKFLGEVDPDRLPAIERALGEAVNGTKAFELPLGTLGAFPHPGNPRVIWVGCDAVPPLEILQHRVERAMAGVGYPVEGKPFRPHLTVGRAQKTAKREDWQGLGDALDAIEFHDMATVASVDIMESTLRPRGPEYRVRTSVSLEA